LYGDQVRPLFAVCNPEIYFAIRTTGFFYRVASQNQATKFIVRQAPSELLSV